MQEEVQGLAWGPEVAPVFDDRGDVLIQKMAKPKHGKSTGDRRRKHRHWRVTVYYGGGERFARVYIDIQRARRFAERQKKSPVVTRTRIVRVR